MFGPGVKFTDQEFLSGLRSGNTEILEALYRKYFGLVLKLIVNNSGSREEARDIYQDTLIVLVENARDPAFSLSCQLQTYIYSVAKRLWLKQLRRQDKRTLIREQFDEDVESATADTDRFLESEVAFTKMEKSLVALGEPCSTLISDFYTKGLSMEVIAEKFGYTSADSAKNQKYKCLQRLKKIYFDLKQYAEEAGNENRRIF
jgi:RNA polymerase sigma factor (sigma-70 family)